MTDNELLYAVVGVTSRGIANAETGVTAAESKLRR
jgi:hypothetical protein